MPDWKTAKEVAGDYATRLGADAVAIIGGAELYRLALPEADRLHLTLVHARPEGDVLFPPYDADAFEETAREMHPASPDDDHAVTFVDLVRRVRDVSP